MYILCSYTFDVKTPRFRVRFFNVPAQMVYRVPVIFEKKEPYVIHPPRGPEGGSSFLRGSGLEYIYIVLGIYHKYCTSTSLSIQNTIPSYLVPTGEAEFGARE